MDGRLHLFGQDLVDAPLSLHRTQAVESVGHDEDAEMPSARRSGVAGMLGALVDYVDLDRSERFSQFLLDVRASIHERYHVAGSFRAQERSAASR
jgi:hypothetical protein